MTASEIVILGCGRMGSALLGGWLAGGLDPTRVHVVEPSPSDWLRGTRVALNGQLPSSAEVALIAVKPQMMASALPALRALGGGGTLMLSIAAGTTIRALAEALGPGTQIVRAMPNTPALVGRGITALVAGPGVSAAQMDRAMALMAAVGAVERLEDEGLMDAVTALSGSGPAYVFHLIETMAAAGAAQGLAPDMAMRLARATVTGAGELAHRSTDTAERLRVNVTSPGGTTAAALAILMDAQAGLPPLMARAIAAAAARGRELGA
ncbi:MAG TPA: pyrroline-5-carboxylate reductase [Paracoccaceae bacterium]|nr:pyrroline-5-carboxylate reductase [Paracoccaceae bacterium]